MTRSFPPTQLPQPFVAIGTYKLNADSIESSIHAALQHNINSIDTASIYQNEQLVAEAINSYAHQQYHANKNIQLSDSIQPLSTAANESAPLCITSKVQPRDLRTSAAVMKSCDRSLEKLQLHDTTKQYFNNNVVYIMLLHWCTPAMNYSDMSVDQMNQYRMVAYNGLQQYMTNGKYQLNYIGVSNYSLSHIKALIEHPQYSIPCYCNQIELHPLLYHTHLPLIQYCTLHNIQIHAYSVLGQNNHMLITNRTIVDLADKYNVTSAQILIRWCIQHSFTPVYKSTDPQHIQQLCSDQLSRFVITDSDMLILDDMESQYGTHYFTWNKSVDSIP